MVGEKSFAESKDKHTLYLTGQERDAARHHVHLPLTPPATDEGRQAVDEVLRTATWRHHTTGHPAPLTEFKITRQQYENGLDRLERRQRRFDLEPATESLTLRMPSPVHDFFSNLLAQDVQDWLQSIVDRGGKAGEFASKVASGGSSRIVLEEGDSEWPIRRQPDAQFQHNDTAYPGVVVEVSYSQDGKDLHKLAQDYILYSNGDIKAVIGIDINYGGRESTVSLWRPKYTRSDGEGPDVLEAWLDTAYKPFRSVNGSATNDGESLHIDLSDFATDEISSGHESVTLSLPFRRLVDHLARAERIQQAREGGDGRRRIKSRRPTTKQRHPSSPIDALKSEDEASFLYREIEAVERAEAADPDFGAPPAKRRAKALDIKIKRIQ